MSFVLFYYILTSFFFSQPSLDQPIFSLTKTACYGTCPQYKLRLFDNGLIIYEGKMFVEKTGCFQFHISISQLNELLKLINEVNYFELDSLYDANVSDVQSIITEFKYKNQEKKIIDRFKGPKDLEKIYKLIDHYVESNDNWLKCNN